MKFSKITFIDKYPELEFAYLKDYDPNKSGKYIFGMNDDSICRRILDEAPKKSFQGFFSGVVDIKGSTYIYRDPNGFSKLYAGEGSKGNWIFSRSWLKIVKEGIKIDNIYALPSGYIYKHEKEKLKCINKIISSKGIYEKHEINIELEKRLNLFFSSFFKWGKKFFNAKEINVCIALSGGLDSSTLLAIGSGHQKLKSHTLELPGSIDSKLAAKIAEKCNSDISSHSVSTQEILNSLKIAPLFCEDWRDFNVHCAALNLLLAKKIKEINHGQTFVFTGDLMNEYLCDYQEESYKGKNYYKLPKINKKSLQRWLVKGLTTSSREDRVFASQGLITVQPYASFYDLYSNLTKEDLESRFIKKECNLTKKTKWLDSLISNTKLRAQIGTKESMGILGIAVDNKLTDHLFAQIIGDYCHERVEVIQSLIFGGTFRSLLV